MLSPQPHDHRHPFRPEERRPRHTSACASPRKKGQLPTAGDSEELRSDRRGRRGSVVWFMRAFMLSCTDE